MNDVCIMIKPASSLCNLRCKYCFYADVVNLREICSFGIMPGQTAEQILENIFADMKAGDHITFAFQGGEPTIAGLTYFQHFVQEVNRRKGKVRIDYALQTNGTLLDEKWCVFLKENRFLVGLSLDAMEENHDACRVDADGKGTFGRVMAAKGLLDRYGIPYNVLITLTNSLARYPRPVWRFIHENEIQYVQFTPCLGSLEKTEENNPYALTPIRFAKFYKQLFTMWLSDWRQGKYTSIKLFDDLMNLLAYGEITACGITGQCLPQIVVEADGSVYPCDFYMLDDYKVGNLCTQSLKTLLQSPVMKQFRCREACNFLCKSCRYQKMCGGGCRRMHEVVCYTEAETYCGYRDFLDGILEDLYSVVRKIQSNRV